jgi:hypothetical protein
VRVPVAVLPIMMVKLVSLLGSLAESEPVESFSPHTGQRYFANALNSRSALCEFISPLPMPSPRQCSM